jgi:hypothetical protein
MANASNRRYKATESKYKGGAEELLRYQKVRKTCSSMREVSLRNIERLYKTYVSLSPRTWNTCCTLL